MKYTPRLPEKNVNVSRTSPLKEFFILVGGLAAMITGAYFLLGLAVERVIPHVSFRVEQALAPSFLERFTDSSKSAPQTRSLQALSDRLQDRCVKLPYRFRVHFSDSEQVNAVALPGGHIVVFKGLLDKMASENELAFVLFHEMGHFAHRDHLRGMGRSLVLVFISTVILGTDNSLSSLFLQGVHLSEMKFSRTQETLADEFAMDRMACAFGHVSGASDFFRKIGKKEKPAGAVGRYYLSHPESRERIRHLKQYAEGKGYSESGTLVPLSPELKISASGTGSDSE